MSPMIGLFIVPNLGWTANFSIPGREKELFECSAPILVL